MDQLDEIHFFFGGGAGVGSGIRSMGAGFGVAPCSIGRFAPPVIGPWPSTGWFVLFISMFLGLVSLIIEFLSFSLEYTFGCGNRL